MVPDRTDRVALLRRHRIALETFRPALDDGAHLSHVPARARLDQRDVRCEAHAVHVPARAHVVERVEHDVEGLESRCR